MKAKFGMIVVAGRGKIGGHVASANRSGAYFRTKVTPVNPQTSFQQAVRNRLGSLNQAWRGLTPAQRAGWNGAVQGFAKTDIFGDIRNPSGINLFQRLNNNLLAIGESQISSAPQPEEVLQVGLDSISVAVTGPQFDIDFDGAVPAGTAVKVYATPPVSPGISFVKSEYRLIDVLPPASLATVDISTEWIARFGSLVEGAKVFVAVEFVNQTTGQASPRQSASSIIAS